MITIQQLETFNKIRANHGGEEEVNQQLGARIVDVAGMAAVFYIKNGFTEALTAQMLVIPVEAVHKLYAAYVGSYATKNIYMMPIQETHATRPSAVSPEVIKQQAVKSNESGIVIKEDSQGKYYQDKFRKIYMSEDETPEHFKSKIHTMLERRKTVKIDNSSTLTKEELEASRKDMFDHERKARTADLLYNGISEDRRTDIEMDDAATIAKLKKDRQLRQNINNRLKKKSGE